MGARKSIRAEKLKAEKKQKAIAVLNDCPTSPLKMRIVADLIRGVEINKALGILRYSKKQASIRLEKLLRQLGEEKRGRASGGQPPDRKGNLRERRQDAQARAAGASRARSPHSQAFEPCDDRRG